MTAESMKRFFKSVKHALRGAVYVAGTEKNFQLEITAATLVIVLMFLLPLTRSEQVALVLVIVGVLVLELVNTSIERVVDMLKPRVHPYARIAKDVMAAAVLVASIGAVIIGFIILSPYILQVLK